MITKKRVTIPIFNYGLSIYIYDKWDEVKELFGGGAEPWAITTRTGTGSSIVAVNSKHGSSIVHEAHHIKDAIWEFIGYTPQVGNDEVDAYLITYIYDKIVDVFYKHDKIANSFN